MPAVQTDGVAATVVLPGFFPSVPTGDQVLVVFEHGAPLDALGDPVTFTYNVRNSSSACEGTHVLYQDVVVPSGEGGVPKGGWIVDVTYEPVEILGQPTVAMETLTTAHEGLLL